MKTIPTILCCMLALAFSARCEPSAKPSPAAATQKDKEPLLRARVLEFAGALGNEGFKVRDGFWIAHLESGAAARLAVNLFAGNHYWFCAAAPERSPESKISLFDPQGEPVKTKDHKAADLAAAGVTATTTGRYVVQVENAGGAAVDICLVYLFK